MNDVLTKCLKFPLLGMLALSGAVFAEGNCPSGQYPVGGQGAQGCAPISRGASGLTGPVAAGKWRKTWGAIVVDNSTGYAAPVVGLFSKVDAIAAAKKECNEGGGVACEFVYPFKNQCAALAVASNGGYAASGGGSEKDAQNSALGRCSKYGACDVIFAGCAKPVFERY